MSVATSRLRSSPFFNSLSCRIFLCLFPTVSCLIIRSPDSALSLHLHFEAWIRQRCKKTSISCVEIAAIARGIGTQNYFKNDTGTAY